MLLNLLVFLPVVWLLLQLLALYLQAQRLLQVRFRYPRYEVQSLKELPDDLKLAFHPTIMQLKSWGFKVCGAYSIQKIFHFELADDRAVLLYHPQTQTYAEVEIRYPADGKDLTSVSFYQVFDDQTWLLTMNGLTHGIVETLPDTIVEDPYCASLEAQWQHHQTKLKQLHKLVWELKPGAFLTALQKQQQRYIDSLLAKKVLVVSRDGWFLTFQSAWKLAWKQRRHITSVSKRQSARQQLIRKQPELLQEVPVGLQVQTFHRLRALEANHRDLRLGKWIFLGSLGLFVLAAIALPHISGAVSAQDLCTILLVLLFHELGHFGAMKLFGYRDTKMFFLPMFGAAVTGKKADASLSEKVWVLLAGPLPGLIVGFVLMGAIAQWPQLDGLEHPAWMLIVLNLLNLLPIYPLDGGKIANHLLFSRYPWTDTVFKVITVILFGLLGLASPPLLLLAIATAVSIPTSYRTAKLNLMIQQQLGDLSNPKDLLPLIFRKMGDVGYAELPAIKRDAMAKEVLERQREARAPILSRWGLASVYGMSLCFGLAGTVSAVLPKAAETFAQQPDTQVAQAEMEREIAQISEQIATKTGAKSLYQKRAQLYQNLFSLVAMQTYERRETVQADTTSFTPDHPGYQYLVKALADYDLALQATIDWEMQERRANLLILMGRRPQAVKAYTALIQQQPKRWQFYLRRANLYQTLENYQAVIVDASAIIQLQPKMASAYELRSQAKQRLGDQAGAQVDQAKAKQLWQQVASINDL